MSAIEKPPLRALKKQRTAQVLRDTARDYFKRMPYDEAKLTDIAQDAEVSATTVYNYFPTKLELLYAVIEEDNLDIVEKSSRLHSRKWDDAVDATVAFAKLFFTWFDSYHRSVMQAVVAAGLVAHSKEKSEYENVDKLEARALIDLVAVLQKRGLMNASLDATFVGSLLFNIMNAEFISFVRDETRTVGSSCALLRRQFEFVAPTWALRRSRKNGD